MPNGGVMSATPSPASSIVPPSVHSGALLEAIFLERFYDGALQRQRVNRSFHAIDHFAARADQHGEGQRATPVLVEGFHQLVLVRFAEQQVFVRGLLLLEKGQRLFFLVGKVCGYGKI